MLFASYEERCLSVAKEAANANFAGNVLIYFCDDISDQGSKEHLQKMQSLFDSCEIAPVQYTSPISMIHHAAEFSFQERVLVDITCFNRENFFSFLWASKFGIMTFPQLSFAYTRANSYGDWLSRDYGAAHNIIGFGGTRSPHTFRHLICCVGFESERAMHIVVGLEPSSLTLAVGTNPPKDAFVERNNSDIQRVFGNQDFEITEINLADPNKCLRQLEQIVEMVPDNNSIHIAPFSNKMSCLAIYSMWLARPDIRIWNAQPTTYNVVDYSAGVKSTEYLTVIWNEIT